MSTKRKIEIFSAGCSCCEDAIKRVNQIACLSCDVQVLDIRQEDVAARAKHYSIRSVPAIVIDGNLADCCAGRGIDENTLRAGGVGVPLS